MDNNVTAQRVREDRRSHHVSELFGSHFPMLLEPTIYTLAAEFSSSYRGGYWHFHTLSNGGFYMAPDEDNIFPVLSDNGFQGDMSADALGITASLYAYSHLSFNSNIDRLCAEHYHLLRDFMMAHAEATTILAAID